MRENREKGGRAGKARYTQEGEQRERRKRRKGWVMERSEGWSVLQTKFRGRGREG
jgi:hypothetical protein